MKKENKKFSPNSTVTFTLGEKQRERVTKLVNKEEKMPKTLILEQVQEDVCKLDKTKINKI